MSKAFQSFLNDTLRFKLCSWLCMTMKFLSHWLIYIERVPACIINWFHQGFSTHFQVTRPSCVCFSWQRKVHWLAYATSCLQLIFINDRLLRFSIMFDCNIPSPIIDYCQPIITFHTMPYLCMLLHATNWLIDDHLNQISSYCDSEWMGDVLSKLVDVVH